MRVGYNHFISIKGEWNNCFSKFSNRVLAPSFISTILQSGKFLNLAHYFPCDVKLRLLAHSRSFLANQKARNAIVEAENLLNNNYSMSPSWIWSDKITNKHVARVGYNTLVPEVFLDFSPLRWENREAAIDITILRVAKRRERKTSG